MFAVHPKEDCPHLKNHFAVGSMPSKSEIVYPSPCSKCQDTSENWLCLQCWSIGCSRYVKSHQAAHYDATKHAIALSFSDLSVWCYECDSYIKHPQLQRILKLVSEVKFSTDESTVVNVSDNSSPSSSPSIHSSDKSEDEDSEDVEPDLLSQMIGMKVTADKAKGKKILETVDLAGVAKLIASGQCKNVIVMSGAGISVAAGIPDFRSPGTGLYDNLQKYNLPHPTAVFEIDYFRKNPEPFYLLAKELYPGNFDPTPCHYFVKLLESKGILLRNFTQNIDTLERIAGVSDDKLVEAHGSFATAHCIDCKKEEKPEAIKVAVFANKVPRCTYCGGLVKPDIVFFGEGLPDRFFSLMAEDFPKCDLLIVMGTSLQVQPFASLIGRVSKDCPRVLVNREEVASMEPNLEKVMGFSSTFFRFKLSDNYRDVPVLGDCQDGIRKLAAAIGWEADLDAIIKNAKNKN